MFKTKGFSSNNSLKRRAIIVDAPDLPPEECEFFITSAGVADTEKAEVSKTRSLDFEVETLFEEESDTDKSQILDGIGGEHSLVEVKGIGEGTAKNLVKSGIQSVEDLIKSDPESLASKISGVSSKKVVEWQSEAKVLLSI